MPPTINRDKILQQLLWDYKIPSGELDAVLKGEKVVLGHFTRELLFKKIIETYSWFTILQLFTPEDIKTLLTNETISKIRTASLRLKYEFVQKRLQEIIPTSG
jgi:hypothetical protein